MMNTENETALSSIMVSTIQAALFHYQVHVQNTLKERAAAKGKEKASPDISLQEERFKSQLLALQACLSHVQTMATAIMTSQTNLVNNHIEPIDENPPAVLHGPPSIDDDTPYENPFTGQMIHPQTLFTPGPSSAIGQDTQSFNIEEARVAALRSELGNSEYQTPIVASPNIENHSLVIAGDQGSQAGMVSKKSSNEESGGLLGRLKSTIINFPSRGVPVSQEKRAKILQSSRTENVLAQSTNLEELRPTLSMNNSVSQKSSIEIDNTSREEKQTQAREALQTFRGPKDGKSDKSESQPSTQESPHDETRSEPLTLETKASQQAAPMPGEQDDNWMVQTYANMAASYYRLHFEDSTMPQEEVFQQGGQAPEPWVAQFNADRAAALAIAGDVPQDFDAFKDINTKHEAKFREEQQLARELIEERERQEMDQQLAAIRQLRAECDAESAKISEQAQYAQQLWDEERKRVADAERSAALARELQAEWEAQSGAAQEQDAYVRQLWWEENAAEEQFASSRALAERLQAEWQAEAGGNYQDEAFDPDRFSPTGAGLSRNSEDITPFETSDDSSSTMNKPPPYSQVAAGSYGYDGGTQQFNQQKTRDTATPRTSQPKALTEDIPDAIRSLPLEAQQQFLEAQKIQAAMNDQAEKENRDWAAKQEHYRKQEQEEHQREVTRLQDQKEARRLEAEQRRLEAERKETQRRNAEAQAARLKAQQRALEEARRKQELEAECIVCSDAFEKQRMAILPCKHAYCGPCTNDGFHSALRSKKPFQCCKTRVAVQTVAVFLDPSFVATYQAWIAEFDTPNPLYCHERRCAAFIPPDRIEADIGACPRCSERTCRLCRQAWHRGVCVGDREGEALLRTARQQHWQTCPNCGTLVERSEGCLHMTCTCGAEFCYNCGESYPSRCTGHCRRRY